MDTNPSIAIFDVAARLAKLSGWARSNLELQKLCYLTQLFALGQREKPLFKEIFEAWRYGPVCPALYMKLKDNGAQQIPEECFSGADSDADTKDEFILYMHELTKNKGAPRLIEITHWEHGAWLKNHVHGLKVPISHEDMLQEYKMLTQ